MTGCVVVKAAKAVVDEEHVNSKLIVLSAASVLAGTVVSMYTRCPYIRTYIAHTNAIHEDANVYRYLARHMRMDTMLGAMTLLEHARSRHPRRRHGSQRAGLLWGLRRSRRAEAQGQVRLFLSELSGHLNSLLMSWSTTYLIIHSHTRELQLKLAAVETHTAPLLEWLQYYGSRHSTLLLPSSSLSPSFRAPSPFSKKGRGREKGGGEKGKETALNSPSHPDVLSTRIQPTDWRGCGACMRLCVCMHAHAHT